MKKQKEDKENIFNVICPFCDKTITDKDLKHFKCTRCGAEFKVKFKHK